MLFVKRGVVILLMGYNAFLAWQGGNKQHRLARVYDEYLYEEDLQAAGLGPECTLAQKEQYIQQWIEKQLIIAAATKEGGYNKAEIDRKLLAYRYALLTHAYVEKQVQERLVTQVEPKEIEAYYQANLHNFELKYTIAKGKLLVVPRKDANSLQLRTWLLSNKPADQAALRAYCENNHIRAALDTETWCPFDSWVQGTPFHRVPDAIRFLRDVKNRPFFRQRDAHFIYYLVVKDYKIAHKPSPLDFVTGQIESIILHQRKIALSRQIEQELIQKEKKHGNYEIYAPK